jgi:sec-independent protein translocase protein TatB
MGSLTFSEIATIAIIVLIVFGPKRLPELARRAGKLMAKVRDATQELREELREEYQETVAPLDDVRRDLEAARRDLSDVARSMSDDLRAATAADASDGGPAGAGPEAEAALDDVRRQLESAREELEAAASGEVADAPEDDEGVDGGAS